MLAYNRALLMSLGPLEDLISKGIYLNVPEVYL